tara:strand:- start:457 stop:774 length:318 start_codon:yes stop_codon:yes gene_type:complete
LLSRFFEKEKIMAAIKSATRRLRSIKGSCFLTHGADSYDKQGMKKALRAMGKALLDEEVAQELIDDLNYEEYCRERDDNLQLELAMAHENFTWSDWIDFPEIFRD